MKLKLTIDLELSPSQKAAIQNDLIPFCQAHLKMTGTVTEAELIEEIPVSRCGFPKELQDCLQKNNIDYLYDLHKLRFSQLYHIISTTFDSKTEKNNYIAMIHKEMKKYRIRYLDSDIDILLIPIKETDLPNRTKTCLVLNGYIYLQDITVYSRYRISRIRHLGPIAMKEIDEELMKHGLWYSDGDFD